MYNKFSGWYFKCQSHQHSLALIPAVHAAGNQVTGSVQLITPQGAWCVPYPPSRVHGRGPGPRMALGESLFSPRGIRLRLRDEGLEAEGELTFGPLSPFGGDIMGPFRFVPFLECRHILSSMEHTVEGSISVNGTTYDFHQGRGYLEGDRGRSFPRHYLWTQCFFPGGALMLCVAEIPLGSVRFTGVIGVVQIQGQQYRLGTYLGARAEEVGCGAVTVRQRELVLTARLIQHRAVPLAAPVCGAMERTVREGLSCRAAYRCTLGGRPLFDLECDSASFEYEYPY